MKGFLNEQFVDRIFGFLTNSATKLDLDLKRRLVEILFESKNRQSKRKKVGKRPETSWKTLCCLALAVILLHADTCGM